MPFNDEKWSAPASRGDAAGAHLDLSIAIGAIETALHKVQDQTGVNLDKERQKIKLLSDEAFKRFVDMTGWEPAE